MSFGNIAIINVRRFNGVLFMWVEVFGFNVQYIIAPEKGVGSFF